MKKGKKKTLKGSVLFTVVSVMALMIIFLTGTLALASASNNRAHKSYSSSQASYTARAAIQSFTEAMQREEGIVAAVQALGKDGRDTVMYPEVTIGDSTLGVVGYYDASGTWHGDAITVELVSEGEEYAYYHDGKSGTTSADWHPVDIVRITATCRVGKEEETVSAVIKKSESGASAGSTPSRIKGLQSIGEGYMPAGGTITGGLGLGLTNSIRETFKIRNKTILETTLTFINGSLIPESSGISIRVKDPKDKDKNPMPYSETIINGNLYIPNNNFIIVDYTMTDNFTQKEIPYLYVDGAVFTRTAQNFLTNSYDQNPTPGTGQPYNIFCGTFRMENQINFSGVDLYLMDEYTTADPYTLVMQVSDQPDPTTGKVIPTDTMQMTRGDNKVGANSSYLYNWVNSVKNKTEMQHRSVGGNIYCNGNLNLSNIEVHGDVRVMGDCVIDGNCFIRAHGDENGKRVGGNLVVQGKLTINGKITLDGTIFCDPDKIIDNSGGSGNYTSSGGSYGVVQPGYKEVPNIFHDEEEIDSESIVQLVECAEQREYFKWDPNKHNSDSGGRYRINGEVTQESGDYLIGYYRMADEYARGMKQYYNDDTKEYKYSYGDFPFMEEGFEYKNDVDTLLSKADDTYKYGSDPDVQDVLDKLINKENPKSMWDVMYGSSTYRVRQSVWYDSFDEPHVIDASIPYDGGEFWFDLASRSYVSNDGVRPAYYTIADFDGNDTGIETTETKSYYRIEDRERVTEYEATYEVNENSGVKEYRAFGQKAYPDSMTREAIYGEYNEVTGQFTPANPSTKIVRNIQEVRKEMDYEEDDMLGGQFSKKAYPDELEAKNRGENAFQTEADGRTIRKNGNQPIRNESTGIWGSKDGKYFIKDNCTLTGQLDTDITIRPHGDNGGEVWIYLDHFTLNGGQIIVDNDYNGDGTPDGTVNFMISGDFDIKIGGSIITKDLHDNINGTTNIKYDRDFGIIFFGEASSSITIENPSTLCGSFKTPYTTLTVHNEGKYNVVYTDEYGEDWTGKPTLLGNALVMAVKGQSNNFSMFFTETGGAGGGTGGGEGFKDAFGGYYEVGYFSGT